MKKFGEKVAMFFAHSSPIMNAKTEYLDIRPRPFLPYILFLFYHFYGYGSVVKEHKDSVCVSSYYRAFLFLFFTSARKFSHQTRSLRTKASKMRTLGVRAREKALNDHMFPVISTYLYQSDCNDTLEST